MQKYARNMQEICKKYARNMRNMQKICNRVGPLSVCRVPADPLPPPPPLRSSPVSHHVERFAEGVELLKDGTELHLASFCLTDAEPRPTRRRIDASAQRTQHRRRPEGAAGHATGPRYGARARDG